MVASHILASCHLHLLGYDIIAPVLEVCDPCAQTEISAKVERIHWCDAIPCLHIGKDGICLCEVGTHVLIV